MLANNLGCFLLNHYCLRYPFRSMFSNRTCHRHHSQAGVPVLIWEGIYEASVYALVLLFAVNQSSFLSTSPQRSHYKIKPGRS